MKSTRKSTNSSNRNRTQFRPTTKAYQTARLCPSSRTFSTRTTSTASSWTWRPSTRVNWTSLKKANDNNHINMIIILLFIKSLLSGTIQPFSGFPPIANSLANAAVSADYTFSFRICSIIRVGDFPPSRWHSQSPVPKPIFRGTWDC